MMTYRSRMVTTAAGLCVFLAAAGCVSDHPGSSSLAYVDIESEGVPAVRQAVIRVFEDDGYTLMESSTRLVFEREATQRDTVMFAHYGDDRLVMRVVVGVEPRRMGGSLVRCDVYAVRDGQAEALPRMARRPYQNQLNRVKASFVEADGAAAR